MTWMNGSRPDRWCREVERISADVATGWGDFEPAHLEAAIASVLQRVGDAVEVDRVSVAEYGDDGELVNTFRWSGAAAEDSATAESGDVWALWEQFMPDRAPLVLERMPAAALVEPAAQQLEMAETTAWQSVVVLPVRIGRTLRCAFALECLQAPHEWPEALVSQVRVIAALVGAALQRRQQDAALRETRAEMRRLAAQFEREKEPFDAVPDASAPQFDGIIGTSETLRSALVRVQEVAPTSSSVLLLGETGTGKELFARAIHAHGPRRQSPLVIVNCAALPPTLIESELFGHARGAFTGAVTMRQGRFELAHRGTLFLDEIGDLPLDLQAKLLRVLQEGAFERVGSSQTQKVDVRIIAATNRDLQKLVADGTFRDDLYYRLSVFPIRLPPLRERRDDIPALVWFVIHSRQRAMHRWIKRVPDSVMSALQRHDWPGNVRELENVLERALIHSSGDTLRLLEDSFDSVNTARPADDTTLSAVERTHIEEVLRACRWRINGPGNAAERLGLHPNTLRFRMKKLGIVRAGSRPDVQVARA